MPACCGGGQEVRRVIVECPAHRGQPNWTAGEDLTQAVHADPDQMVPGTERLGGRDDLGAERAWQVRDHHIRPGQRDPAISRQAVVRNATVPVPLVGFANPKCGDRPAAEYSGGIDGLAGGDAREPPPCPRAEVARSLGPQTGRCAGWRPRGHRRTPARL